MVEAQSVANELAVSVDVDVAAVIVKDARFNANAHRNKLAGVVSGVAKSRRAGVAEIRVLRREIGTVSVVVAAVVGGPCRMV